MKVEIKKYLPYVPWVIMIIGVMITAYLLFNRRLTSVEIPTLQQLQEQQKQLQKMSEAREREIQESRNRDSILWQKLQENDKDRETKIKYITRDKNEKINHINSESFTADSIRKLFSEN